MNRSRYFVCFRQSELVLELVLELVAHYRCSVEVTVKVPMVTLKPLYDQGLLPSELLSNLLLKHLSYHGIGVLRGGGGKGALDPSLKSS